MTTRAAAETALAERLGSASEARWMVEELAGRDPLGAATLEDETVRALSAMAQRRLAGEPLQYVLGAWAFRTLDLAVDARALIPRPETEQVVEEALTELRHAPTAAHGHGHHHAHGHGHERNAVDLGTGTGAVALSLAAETSGVRVWGTDADADAFALAGENRSLVGARRPEVAARVELCLGDWYGPLPARLRGKVDLVVSNPPYVSEEEWPDLDPVVRREPRKALVAADGSDGTAGFAAVESVLRGAPAWLRPGGAVVVELAPHQAGAASRLAERLGFGEVRTARDLAGRARAVVARR